MEKNEVRNLIWIGLFAIAMAFVEAMIVYYSRLFYYPNGFNFPLNTKLSSKTLLFEWFREISTIIMLLAIVFLVSKKSSKKLVYFAYVFAIWDIFYYIWLKVTLDWPASFLTWDVLFLIPIPWLSPVIVPIIVSLTMMLFSIVVFKFKINGIKIKEWIFLISGISLILITVLWDYGALILNNGFLMKLGGLETDAAFQAIISNHIPVYYNWILFIFGEILAIIGIYLICKRHKKKSRA
jgi:hypothetical protein